ncbi:MAG: thiamine diphosphokinase [Tannerella sp.]|nr:thiamine diphosphokinase [Tannerella sp.]
MDREFSTDADAVILAAGGFPSHRVPLLALEHYRDRIICCDGAADALLQAGFYPEMVIGDGDSISPGAYNKVSDRFICETEQETNDLTKAVLYAVSRNYTRLLILGATGLREDHTLGNISLLADYMDQAVVGMLTDYGVLTPAGGNMVFPAYPGQPISVFCMDQSPLTMRGLKWPVENRIINRWWEATLNEAISDLFEIETTGKVIVFQGYHRK